MDLQSTMDGCTVAHLINLEFLLFQFIKSEEMATLTSGSETVGFEVTTKQALQFNVVKLGVIAGEGLVNGQEFVFSIFSTFLINKEKWIS